MATSIEKLGPDKKPTLDQIKDGTLSEVGWVHEALMYMMLTHLQGTLNLFLQAPQSIAGARLSEQRRPGQRGLRASDTGLRPPRGRCDGSA
jgi:hypothetical protein